MTGTRLLITTIALIGLATHTISQAGPPMISSAQIIKDADETADAQLTALADKFSANWIWGAMEVGYSKFSHVSPKGGNYSDALTAWAQKADWTPPTSKKSNLVLADDFCIGQTFLDLYVAHPSSAKIDPLRKRLDLFVETIKAEPENAPKLTWWWCDALFMAPPVLARMSAITKDPKYIDAMDTEYWRTAASLYDREEHLFYRDGRFVGQKDENGKKIFWSRGNGWVLGGLASLLQYMPADYPSRRKYVALFKEMAARLASLQSADGTWHPSLIDPKLFDGPETSGTSLFTYGIAWGINNNLLDRQTYLPVVARAWSAIISDRRPDGLPGYVEGVADRPKAVTADGTQLYTTGSMLLDATEILKLAPIGVPKAAATTATAPDADKRD